MRGSSYFCQVKYLKPVPGYNDRTREYIRGSVVDVEFLNEQTGLLEKDNIWVDASVSKPEEIKIGGYYNIYRAKNGYVLELFELKEPATEFQEALEKNKECQNGKNAFN